MNNNYDDVYEVDMDADINLRKKLIEEAKAVDQEGNLAEVNRKFTDLKRQWRRIHFGESIYEEELENEFDAILDAFYSKRREGYESNQEMKEALIEKVKKLTEAKNLQQATKSVHETMEEWKSVGSCGKEQDDVLWESFQAARQAFFDRKHQLWEEMQAKFEQAKIVKQEIIDEAASIMDSEEWAKTSDAFKALMDKWKAVGSAGRECEDDLWNAFNKHRQHFYERREVVYSKMRDEQDQKYEQKRALVEQAKAISTSKSFTREHTETMKNLGTAWKAIGNCGRDREDAIWKEFRVALDIYFEGLKAHKDERHAQWRQRLMDTRTHKAEMIQNQKRQIKYLEDEMVGLLGQRAIDDAEAEIENKEEFIQELEQDIADIDKKLAE